MLPFDQFVHPFDSLRSCELSNLLLNILVLVFALGIKAKQPENCALCCCAMEWRPVLVYHTTVGSMIKILSITKTEPRCIVGGMARR